MKNFVIFDQETGEIELSGICADDDFFYQQEHGAPIIEGCGDKSLGYVFRGEIVSYTQIQRDTKFNRPLYPCKWSNSSFEWTDTRSEQQKFNQADASARAKRFDLLSQSDWTQIPNNPLTIEQQESWATYRQALRDVPEQPGYPFSIDWPAPP